MQPLHAHRSIDDHFAKYLRLMPVLTSGGILSKKLLVSLWFTRKTSIMKTLDMAIC
jgi:hypothetical protein